MRHAASLKVMFRTRHLSLCLNWNQTSFICFCLSKDWDVSICSSIHGQPIFLRLSQLLIWALQFSAASRNIFSYINSRRWVYFSLVLSLLLTVQPLPFLNSTTPFSFPLFSILRNLQWILRLKNCKDPKRPRSSNSVMIAVMQLLINSKENNC